MPLRITPGPRKAPKDLRRRLIAPCGINCGRCLCYLRNKGTCQGCRTTDDGKAPSVLACTIRRCEMPQTNRSGFCHECERFPCPRLKRLDARYQTRYRTSLLDNLHTIKESGINAFLRVERNRAACPACGGVTCLHSDSCIYCGRDLE